MFIYVFVTYTKHKQLTVKLYDEPWLTSNFQLLTYTLLSLGKDEIIFATKEDLAVPSTAIIKVDVEAEEQEEPGKLFCFLVEGASFYTHKNLCFTGSFNTVSLRFFLLKTHFIYFHYFFFHL